MGWTLVSHTIGNAFGNVTISKPASIQVGDLLVATITTNGDTPNHADWTLRRRDDGTESADLNVFSRIVDGTEPSSWSWGTTNYSVGVIACYRPDAGEAVTFDTALGNIGDNEKPTAPSITVAANDSLLIYVAGMHNYSPSNPSGYTLTASANDNGVAFITHSYRVVGAGDTGAASSTATWRDSWAAIHAAFGGAVASRPTFQAFIVG